MMGYLEQSPFASIRKVRLELSDLDLEGQRLRVMHGKGNRQRVVAFGDDCRKAVRRYLQARGPRPGRLFLAASGHRNLLPESCLQQRTLAGTSVAPKAGGSAL